MKQSVFLQANGLAFPYVSDILKHLVSNCACSKMKGKIADRYVGCEPEKRVAVLIHRRWNDKETLLQLMMFNIICADPELFLGERAGIRGGNVNKIMVKNIYP